MQKVLALLCMALLTAKAAAVDDNWTHVDSEDDDVEPSITASGDYQYSELKWVTFRRSGGMHVAGADELDQLQLFMDRLAQSTGPFASIGSMQMEDGPAKVDKTKQHSSPLPTSPELHDDSLEAVRSMHFYPNYAIGLLESGCTAFVIGPQHALTAAHCVYSFNESQWQRQLDLWRGRNHEQYLQWMEWEHVSIPLDFFLSGSQDHDWALISFADKSKSPVWLRLAFSEHLEDKPLVMYGYLAKDSESAMYSTPCHSRQLQPHQQLLAIHCETSQDFQGGPLLQGSKSQLLGGGHGLKIPPVYGLSITGAQSTDHTALRIHSELFWTLCWLMEREGFDSHCSPLM